jgi:PPOX class probable F420-dependent enzyme
MALDLAALPTALEPLLYEYVLGTLTTLRPDGSPHVVAVGWTWDPGTRTARVITSSNSRKAAHVRAGSRAVVCSVAGPRWISIEGSARVSSEPQEVAQAEALYGKKYGGPRPSLSRVAIIITADRALGSVGRPG